MDNDTEDIDETYSRLALKIKMLENQLSSYNGTDMQIENIESKLGVIEKSITDIEIGITEYDDKIVRELIESIEVKSKDKIKIHFKAGFELEQTI